MASENAPSAGEIKVDVKKRQVSDTDVAIEIVGMERLFEPEDVVLGENLRPANGRRDIPLRSAAVVGPADIEHDRRVPADCLAHALDMGAVGLLRLAEILPSELEGGIPLLFEHRRLFAGFHAIRAKECR